MTESSDFTRQAARWKRWAPVYDNDSDGSLEPGPAVELLAELANGGPALELGIGTGRLAVPLAHKGVSVTGIDASPQMLARLHEHRGSLAVDRQLADMADFRLPGKFPLVYVTASTIFLVTSAERQASCFRSVAAALNAGGRFVVDAAYGSKANRRSLRAREIPHTIPERNDVRASRARKGSRGGRPPNFDPTQYKSRNQVERGFGRLKNFRAVATRYDKLKDRYAATSRSPQS